MIFELLTFSWWSVAVAAAISVIIGFAWYSPMILGEKWAKILKIKLGEKDQHMLKHGICAYVIALFQAYGLALVLEHFNALDYRNAIAVAFVIALVFLVSENAGSVLWIKKPVKAFYIEAACSLVSFCAMAVFYAYMA